MLGRRSDLFTMTYFHVTASSVGGSLSDDSDVRVITNLLLLLVRGRIVQGVRGDVGFLLLLHRIFFCVFFLRLLHDGYAFGLPEELTAHLRKRSLWNSS